MTDPVFYKPLHQHQFSFPGVKQCYQGKVRDVYDLGDRLLMIASDRISAFDHILPQAIPFKGQVLNQLSCFFLNKSKSIAPNWLITTPDPNVSFGLKCTPIKIEIIVRAYLVGHAWRTYNNGERSLCGVPLPEGLRQNDPLPNPIITPAIKADEGHDEDISAEDILEQNIISQATWDRICDYALSLFQWGTETAKERDLILVDTKYEFGLRDGELMLIDEIHTPDSSRYFELSLYDKNQRLGLPQKQLSKEFVREWLMAHGFQGHSGQSIPTMPPEFIAEVTERYIHLYERLTGLPLDRMATDIPIVERIDRNIRTFLSH